MNNHPTGVRILLVDLLKQCHELDQGAVSLSLLTQSFPGGNLHVENQVDFDPSRVPWLPDVILFRSDTTVPGSVFSHVRVRQKWPSVYMVGLLCVHDEPPVQDIWKLTNEMDDFLFCPYRTVELVSRVQRLLFRKKVWRPETDENSARERLQTDSLIGESACFLRLLENVPRFARSDATVLILGETGTGKELFAKAIHDQSRRNGKPFVAINCGAVPDQLFENELFGHARGAYTTATSPQQGLVGAAEGGTLLLDEVDDLTDSAQTKLLRFLQDRTYHCLGSPQERRADVRILAATNSDLAQLVARERFRPDLYHRLNVLSFSIPALRERMEDIPLLATHFVNRYQREYGVPSLRLAPSAVRRLMAYHWPGNVRELEGVLQRAVVMSSSSILDSEDLSLPADQSESLPESSWRGTKSRMIERFEQAYLKSLLRAYEGNLTRAARAAGTDRRAFQRLVRRYGLDRESFRPSV